MSTAIRTYYRGHNLVQIRNAQAGENRLYHFDHQGTTQALTASTGTVSDRFSSDAWGVPVKHWGSSINRHWYIGNLGYYSFPSAADYYVRARHLSSHLARWQSMDSLARRLSIGAGPGAFLYGRNSPSYRVDPSGHFSVDPNCATGDTKECSKSRIEILKRTVGRLCGPDGIQKLKTEEQWMDIWACAKTRENVAPYPIAGFTWRSLMTCMQRYCTSQTKVYCSTAKSDTSCARKSYCMAAECEPGKPNPQDIYVCLDASLPCGTCGDSTSWNSMGCNSEVYGDKCNESVGREEYVTLLHEMTHACGACYETKKIEEYDFRDELWADAVSCCLVKALLS